MSFPPALSLAFLFTLAFSLGTWLQPRAEHWTADRGGDHLVQVLLGDGRQILANQLFTEADIYFHSGYYPSVFDQQYAPTNAEHMTRSSAPANPAAAPGHEADADEHDEEEHVKAMAFLKQPHDWLEQFGRRFGITEHTHLDKGKAREVLPWLRLSADLDPHRIETYTVAAFWLRRELGKPKEAEEFLREGLKANPGSYEILIELGRLYYENDHDVIRARNVWEVALQRWIQRESQKKEPNLEALGQITVRLARAEADLGNYPKAIQWLELALAKNASPHPEALQKQIDELKQRQAGDKRAP